MRIKKIMTLETIKERLKSMNLRVVSHDVGIEYMRLWQTVKGNRNAYYEDVKKLSDYLESL